jgi:hypothetical protein
MYEGWKKRGALSSEWVAKTDAFLDRAFARSETGTDVRCPCSKCRNINFQDIMLFPTPYLRRLKVVGDRLMPSDISYLRRFKAYVQRIWPSGVVSFTVVIQTLVLYIHQVSNYEQVFTIIIILFLIVLLL